ARRYREYIAWLERQERSRAEEFWRRTLAGFSDPTPLPALRHVPGVSDNRGAGTAMLTLSPERTRALQEQARGWGVTMSTLVQGAWGLLLGRYAGESDVVFGATVSGRPAELPGVEETVGLFINAVPVRVRLNGDAQLREWLAELQKEQVEAREHEYAPLVEVHKWSEVPGGRPLFDSMVVFENFPVEQAVGEAAKGLGGLRVRPTGAREQANYPLLLSVVSAAQLKAEIRYDRARVDVEAVGRLVEHLDVLLEAVAAHPGRRLSEVSLLRESERAQLLAGSRAEPLELQPTYVHEMISAQAERTPGAPAVSFGDGTLSYAELESGANRLAHHLRRLGVGPDTRVGICLERSLDMVVGVLGVLRAGGAYVPLDPSYPAERLAYMMEDAALGVLLTREGLLDGLPQHGARAVCLDRDAAEIARQSAAAPESRLWPESLAYVIYTSGSTGRPKGVEIVHRGLGNYLGWAAAAYAGEGRGAPVHSSLTFDLTVTSLLVPLVRGERVVLTDEAEGVEGLARVLREEPGFTLVKLTPAHLGLLAEQLTEAEAAAAARTLVVGGEALPAELAAYWRRVAPDTALVNEYGPTETVVGCSVYRVPDESVRGSVPIGRPIAGTQLYVLGGEMQLAPVGMTGELYVGGPGVARGYLGRPGLTAETFVPDPFGGEAGARLYRTGDRARWRMDGELEYLGRIDAQVKVRGFRIEPGEIEAVLLEQEAVREAVVLVREDAPGQKRLVAYVAPQEGAELAADGLRARLVERLPEHMVPVAFVTLESIPLTSNGKVDRRALPRPESTGIERSQAYEAPRDGLEETITALFEEVLGVSGVGLHDNFFELGGHSLLGVQIMSRLKEATGVNLPLAAIFKAPTVERLAEEVRSGGGDMPLMFPLRFKGSRPPLFLVHPGGGNLMSYAGLVKQLDEDQPVYGLRSRGIEQGETPNWTIEEMARDYLASIREVRPSGPYRLGGWSMGGVIAFEMARQLEAAGEEVESLVLIDSQVPWLNDPDQSMPGNEIRVVQLFAQDLGFPVDRLPTADPEAQGEGEVAYLRLMLDTARAAGLLPKDLELARIQQLYGIFRINLQAMFAYRPEGYGGDVTLLRAAGKNKLMNRLFGKKAYGWEQVVRGELEVRTVPGTHYTMMRTPHVEKLAREVERAIG
ncbi:MAG: amino acid adenylation domain-containing protein, partial [Longimicrobiaceae bacterium]